jgi:site-specific DNA-methyltransferase (adenine-specific)
MVMKYRLDFPNKCDGLDLLRSTPAEYSPLIFLDPEYDHLMVKLSYGNKGARQGKRFQLPQQSDEQITEFIRESARILKPSGYLALWIDKTMFASGLAVALADGSGLEVKDAIVWIKHETAFMRGKVGMGWRSRSNTEYLVMLQKPPFEARKSWRSRPVIRDGWVEPISNRIHVHQKPVQLQAAIIAATTDAYDVVIDPVAGSFSVWTAAAQEARHFLGGDLLGAPEGFVAPVLCEVLA